MIRLSRDNNFKNEKHRPLSHFVKRSWAQQSAGGGKSYMKPQCVFDEGAPNKSPDNFVRHDYPGERSTKTIQQAEASDQPTRKFGDGKRVALYMPYLFWTDWPGEDASNKKPANAANPAESLDAEKEVAHDFLTLDQYYYVSLAETKDRDKDQVLSRFFQAERRKKAAGANVKDEGTSNGAPKSSELDTSITQFKILIVNQLWLWVLDDKTIITSTTKKPDNVEKTFFQQVFANLQQKNNKSPSVEHVLELILSTATSIFNEKGIDVLGFKKSPLSVYRETISNARNKEARLFKQFEDSLPPAEDHGEGRNARQQKQEHENPYNNITQETKLLREIKDILDELNMLKSLAEDQERVWNQIWESGKTSNATFTHSTPSEVRREVEGMISETQDTQSAINALLDLKQKQANIAEAQITRKQSDTVMVFTVITILFLPASFLSSIFALKVSDYPHEGSSVTYQGKWIFPIIVGISLGISAIFSLVAFNIDYLRSPEKVKEKVKENRLIKQILEHLESAKIQRGDENGSSEEPAPNTPQPSDNNV